MVRFENSIVRILGQRDSATRAVVGAGLLICDSLVITCSHVVNLSLGRAVQEVAIPHADITLDFPFINGSDACSATVMTWNPPSEATDRLVPASDISILRLKHAPPEASFPAVLIATSNISDHRFKTYGFPSGHDLGAWAYGIIRDELANGWRQIERIEGSGIQIQPGFSGAAVWDEIQGGILGIIVEAEQGTVAFVIPTGNIVEGLPPATKSKLLAAPLKVLAKLKDLENESVARCVARWESAGVPRTQALRFARDPSVGAISEKLRPDVTRPLKLILGELGLGKSLLGERLLQEAIRDSRSDPALTRPIPVYLEAAEVEGELRRAVEKACAGIGDIRAQGATIILDGLEQPGAGKASNLLAEARRLVTVFAHTTVTITSRPVLDVFGAEERVLVDLLSREASSKLVDAVANQATNITSYPKAIQDAVLRPLFAIMLGADLRGGASSRARSKGELISKLVEKALGAFTGDYQTAAHLLRKLAVESTDRGGGAVTGSDVAPRAQLSQLQSTGLVTEHSGGFKFPLPLLTQWFAAQSLADGNPSVEELLADPARLELWRDPIIIFVSTFGFNEVSGILSFLVKCKPAYSSQIIDEALTQDFEGDHSPPSAHTCRTQLETAMRAWADGAGRLASLIIPMRKDGTLYDLYVAANADSTITTAWSSEPVDSGRLLVPLLPGPSRFVGRNGDVRLSKAKHGHQSAWPWRWTLDTIKYELDELITQSALSTHGGPMQSERAWQTAIEMTRTSPLHTTQLPLDQIEEALPDYYRNLLHEEDESFVIRSLPSSFIAVVLESRRARRSGASILEAPWPGPDLYPRSGTYWEHYSTEQLLKRATAVFEGALAAYEELIETWFSAFACDFRVARTLPAVIRGYVIHRRPDSRGGGNPIIEWYLDPLPRGNRNSVELTKRESEDVAFRQEYYEHIYRKLMALRPDAATWLNFFVYNEQLDAFGFFGNMPITTMVYKWVKSDLGRCRLYSGM
jgi:hypothetical protein